MLNLSEFRIHLNNWFRQLFEGSKSLLEGVFIIIFSLNDSIARSYQASLKQGLLRNIVEKHVLAFAYILLEVNRLVHSSRETIYEVILKYNC